MEVNPVGPEYEIVALEPPRTNGNGTLHHHIEAQEVIPACVLKFRKCIALLGAVGLLLFLLGAVLNASGENEAANVCYMASAITIFVAGCLVPGAIRV